MLKFLRNLFAIFYNVFSSNDIMIEEPLEDITEVERRGMKILIPTKVWKELEEKNYSISVIIYKGNPSSVQILKNENGKCKYISTLKAYMNIKSFVNGNPCDYRKENLIFNN